MIYLDHNSTTNVLEKVKAIIAENLKEPLNASSVHYYGRNARKLLEESREVIAQTLGIKLGRGGYKIIFTSGGTEANNLVINNFESVLCPSIEHAAIIEPAKKVKNTTALKVNKDGIIDLVFLQEVAPSDQKTLVSVMMANNETGVIQPIKEVVQIARDKGFLVHTDMVQAFGKINVNLQEYDVDFATISAHKIGGLVGIGALIVKDNITISPSILGGGQERSERSGTENVLGAICFAKAAEVACGNIDEYAKKTSDLRDYIESEIKKSGNGFVIAKNSNRLPNTSLIASNKVNADAMLIQFDMEGIAVSNGSACSSGKVKSSHVLQAMGYSEDVSKSVIRVSLGNNNTMKDAEEFIRVWNKVHGK